MQRIKGLILLFAVVLVGCASPGKQSDVAFVQLLDRSGKVERTWTPKDGKVRIDLYTDEVSFVDASTGKSVEFIGSHKLLK